MSAPATKTSAEAAPVKVKRNQYVFKAKTKDGFGLKGLAEYISNPLKFPTFQVNDKGIYIRGMDQAEEIGLDIEMARQNFTVFKCPKALNFSVNATHFYRLLKSIKRKDTVSLFILEQRAQQLGICVEQGDEAGDKITTYIQISYVPPDDIELPGPEEYSSCIVETSKRFSKLKTLQQIGTELTATVINGKTITFFVNGKNLYCREVTLGENQDDEDVDENAESYTLTYTTSHITQLTKCAGQCGNIQIFQNEQLPLLMKMQIASLATMSIYIKAHELIDQIENGTQSAEKGEVEKPAPVSAKNEEESEDESETEENDKEDEADE
jgi:Proliferating cell nuclear antigen, N-terminal domain/Proliferating cell nuclear antigen, C-terminal domain